MGRDGYARYAKHWSAPDYTVDGEGKIVGGYVPEGPNNWGRWGEHDQLGTQNLINPEQRIRAASLVRSGRVFSLALPIDAGGPRFHTRPAPLHWFLMAGSDQVVGSPYNQDDPDFQWNDDMLQMPLQGSTQWDGFGHVMYRDTMYNGYWAGNITAYGGASVLGIENHRESFVGRGVLLDLPRSEGLDELAPATVIDSEMLDRCIRSQGTSVESGDIALIRTGYLARWDPNFTPGQQEAYFGGSPGLGVDALTWCDRNDVSAVAADTIGVEVLVPEDPEARRYPVHCGALVDRGLPLGEFWVLDELAADCADDGRYEFMLVAPPLNIPGAVGSPINPIAIK
ncbi:cyclase family protein [Candidatus Poriferisocius sp.]|uniref:cyclase family protein n=1 Tax=Candidatus Poriferisocius sp. TaxID=3101276 RepID=UPI003B024165